MLGTVKKAIKNIKDYGVIAPRWYWKCKLCDYTYYSAAAGDAKQGAWWHMLAKHKGLWIKSKWDDTVYRVGKEK